MSFTLRASHVRDLMDLANFPPPADGYLLFGLRGASPVDDTDQTFRHEHQLNLLGTDYRHMRCTIGIWTPDDRFCVFPGSTVPHIGVVTRNMENRGHNVNQLMLGSFSGYFRGLHGFSHSDGPHRALRQEKKLPIWRTWDDTDFEGDDEYFYHAALDNIHCARQDNVAANWFSSNGCQVIAGVPENAGDENERGPWKSFIDIVYGTSQRFFTYALFAGHEAQKLSLLGAGERYQTVRFGSEGDLVTIVQQALIDRGYNLGNAGADGDFGRMTVEAVMKFQRDKRGAKAPDGIVGPGTGADLGFDWPKFGEILEPAEADDPSPGTTSIDFMHSSETEVINGRTRTFYYATPASGGDRIYLGTRTIPEGIVKTGLVHFSSRLGQLEEAYDPAAESVRHGLWAYVIHPSVIAESKGFYARLNSYDKAHYTFGFYQFAAHTPDENLILLLRRLLQLPEAADYLPDLTLVNGKVHLIRSDGTTRNLEKRISRPNFDFKVLHRFMKYLNPSLDRIDPRELDVSARLISWAINSRDHRKAQVDLSIQTARKKLRAAHKKLKRDHGISLDGRPIQQCLWISDIRHQGRGGKQTYPLLAAALAAPDPVAALKKIGGSGFAGRIKTVTRELEKLEAAGIISNQTYDAQSNTFS